MFDVPGVIVVLAINRAELAHSVQSVYGPNFSADHYLRRFADLHVQLLRPTQPALIPLFQQLIGQAGESSLGYRGIWEMLSLVGEAQGCGLRDIQQAAHHYSAVIATYGTTPLRDPNNLRYSIAALIAFRALDRNSYQSMTKGQIDGFQAIAAVRQSLTPMGASQPSVADKDVKDLEAILFDFASITQLDINEFPPPDLKEDDFLREYQSAIGSDDGNPAEVFRTYKSWKDAMYWLSSPESVKAITIRIDMLSTA